MCFFRFCLISYNEFKNIISFDKFIFRNIENYSEAITLLPENKISIRNKCAFSNLDYFKPYECFPPDIMHDMLLIPLTMYNVLKCLNDDKLISISELNNRLQYIDFHDKCNISLLFKNNLFRKKQRFVGSVMQQLELFFILPRLVDTTKLIDNRYWDIYLLLREILDYLYAPIIFLNCLIYLLGLIEYYLDRYAFCFSKDKLIPKHLHMLHYCHFIKLYRALRYYYCMPFESKHQYFKRKIKISQHFHLQLVIKYL